MQSNQIDPWDVTHLRKCFEVMKKGIFNAYVDPNTTYLALKNVQDIFVSFGLSERFQEISHDTHSLLWIYILKEANDEDSEPEDVILLQDLLNFIEKQLQEQEAYAKKRILGRII
jgi:hypothetical protein